MGAPFLSYEAVLRAGRRELGCRQSRSIPRHLALWLSLAAALPASPGPHAQRPAVVVVARVAPVLVRVSSRSVLSACVCGRSDNCVFIHPHPHLLGQLPPHPQLCPCLGPACGHSRVRTQAQAGIRVSSPGSPGQTATTWMA